VQKSEKKARISDAHELLKNSQTTKAVENGKSEVSKMSGSYDPK